jgi:hypothetical protein
MLFITDIDNFQQQPNGLICVRTKTARNIAFAHKGRNEPNVFISKVLT